VDAARRAEAVAVNLPLVPFDEFERTALPVVKPFRSAFGATWFHEAGRKPARREWAVKDLILARSFGIVFGPPGCGKSFLITDLMLHCAAAATRGADQPPAEWFGHRINPFGVVYVVAEGSDDFVIRLHAWRLNQGIAADAVLPFVFLPTSINLQADDADTRKLLEEVKGIDIAMREKCGVGVGAIIVDTVSRALAGGNENDSAVMGGFVRNCEGIQKDLKVAVIGIHHGGKEAGRGPRGHEALLGAADFTWEVTPRTDEEPVNKWIVRKFKAGAAGASHPFVLRPMTVDHDDDNDPVTSCVVVTRDAGAPGEGRDAGYGATHTEIEFLRVLSDVVGSDGVMPPPDVPASRNVALVVNAERVKAVFRDRYAMTEDGDEDTVWGRLRQRWSRATKSLLRNRVIGSSGEWIWFTGKKVRGVTIRGVEGSEAVDKAAAAADAAARPDQEELAGI
jgi:hypothetical protein